MQNNSRNFKYQFALSVIVFLIIYSFQSFAQWANNPSENTTLVNDVSDPINISTVPDQDGGFFLFWQDNRITFQSEIYFMHLNSYGKPGFITEGKEISTLNGEKINPIALPVKKNTAAVVYRDFSKNKNGNLFIQKVNSNGNLLLGESGLEIAKSAENIIDFSAVSDKKGEIFILFVTQDFSAGEYRLNLQKISDEGKSLVKDDNLVIYKSKNRQIMPSVIADNNGAFVLWIETVKNKSVLFSLHINSSGNLSWKKSLAVSNNFQNVNSYSAECIDSLLYVSWQLQKEKEIYHQVLSSSGKFIWNTGGKISTSMKGIESNPQVLAGADEYILSWINENEDDKNIFIQKYDSKGKPVWNRDGIPVIKLKGLQFGQKLVTDKKGGAIVTWIDRRNESVKGNIYAQRILSNGSLAWDTTGLPVALSYDNEKSYLSIVPDNENGAVVVFKEKRNEKSRIFGHKIFNTGTYVSQILGFTTELINDSVKVSWYCANESPETRFDIERAVYTDTSETIWNIINSYYTKEKSEAKYYEFIDKPDVTGTIYYRIVQKSNEGDLIQSEISKINYLSEAQQVVVAQNLPNPFSDSTVISFYLPLPQEVKVEYFNYRLEKISETVEKEYPAGENFLTFFAEGLQSGIYFYKIILENFVDVKKMVLAR